MKRILYPRSGDKELDPALFKNPTPEDRAGPFWAWNCRLDPETLLEDVEQFRQMGMGGAHIHCRTGLDTPYLGEEFFQIVSACEKKMEAMGLRLWLYDEDRWPSGTAGGLVTREDRYRMRFLVFEPEGFEPEKTQHYMAAAKAVRGKVRTRIGTYLVVQDQDGFLQEYTLLDEISGLKTEKTGITFGQDVPGTFGQIEQKGQIWHAWLEVSGDNPWFNDQAYVNTLDSEAVGRFLERTHEMYYRKLGRAFGSTIPAVFTDEPQTVHKERLLEPFQKAAVILPYTDDFEETFYKRYQISIRKHLPELIWDWKGGQLSKVRYLYHRHLCERFSEAFGDQIGKWCEVHGIHLTGHMMNEWTLHGQTMAVGEVMRPMMHFGIPGMDMLCDRRELSTAKQAASVAHQMGREGVMSELYGVTGWEFDFRNHKLAGDWQAALGVTARVPHLTWASMEGEAKRDYPASIGRQSPWYQEYHVIEDHFARLNTVLTRGRARVRVGVIHPVESYWLYWGNQAQNAEVREALDTRFEEMIEWLLYGLIDFDFISEAVLEELGQDTEAVREALDPRLESPKFVVGEACYETVIIPEPETIRKHTLVCLERFQRAGGEVIFMGKPPACVEGEKNGKARELAESCIKIPYQRICLLKAVERYRDIDVISECAEGEDPTRIKHRENGRRTRNLFYQMREDGICRWLFLCHVKKPMNEDVVFSERLTIEIQGEYMPKLYDTQNGEIRKAEAEYRRGKTILTAYVSAHDSLLYELRPGRADAEREDAVKESKKNIVQSRWLLPQPDDFSLEEENVCLLDLAEYAFDDGPWQEEEEILRIDNRFRSLLGYPLRMEALAQPWTNQEEEEESHTLRLRIRIDSEMQAEDALLAVEHPEKMQIFLNEKRIGQTDRGWYVDRSIRKRSVGCIRKGENVLELRIPFGKKTNVEWCYLLGPFGVMVRGRKKILTAMPERIYFGNLTAQGLPFYAGNFIYETAVVTGGGSLWIEIPRYRGALLQIELDGDQKQNLIFAPYRVRFRVSAGEHRLRIKAYGNRANAFGPVHHSDYTEKWYGPNLWRTQGSRWSYEYQLSETGVLSTPYCWMETIV